MGASLWRWTHYNLVICHRSMLRRRWFRVAVSTVVLILWAAATTFFATVGLLIAHETIARRVGPDAAITNLRQAVITAAYSLGGAVIGLGLAWLALPRSSRRGLRWSAALWLGATLLILGTRRVGGWPLLVAAVVAAGIGLDVSRRLVLTLGVSGAPSEPRRPGI